MTGAASRRLPVNEIRSKTQTTVFDQLATRRKWATSNSPCHVRWVTGDRAQQLVGPVENPTSADDLDVVIAPPPKVAERGVVQRIKAPSSMKPLVAKPEFEESGAPHYAKLRAEASPAHTDACTDAVACVFLAPPSVLDAGGRILHHVCKNLQMG